MVVKRKNKDENWEKLVSSLKKRVEKLNKDWKAGKTETLNAVEVICSHEDIERTRRGWAKAKRK